jgi:hypothetical protein
MVYLLTLCMSRRVLYPLFLLLLPLIGTLVSDDFNWSPNDFLIMGILLFSLGVGINSMRNKIKDRKIRILSIVGLIFLFLLVWLELAVGVFGSPLAGS